MSKPLSRLLSFILILTCNPSMAELTRNECMSDPEGFQRKMDELVSAKYCRDAFNLEVCRSHLSAGSIEDLPVALGLTAFGGLLGAGIATELVSQGNVREVRSLDDFRRYTLLHVERVKALVRVAYREFPEEFPGLTSEHIEKMVHDVAKTNEKLSQQTKALVFKVQSLLKRLFEFYGKAPKNDAEVRKLKKLVAELNELDEKITNSVLQDLKLVDSDGKPNQGGRSYLRLEKISDLVDRGSYRLTPEEMDRPVKLASKVMTDPADKRIAQFLEKNYSHTVKGLDYVPRQSAQSKMKSMGKTFYRASLGRVAISYPELIRKGFSLAGRSLAGGALTLTATTAEALMSSKELSCASVHDGFIDFKPGTCEMEFGYTPNFNSFLAMSPEERLSAVKFDPICRAALLQWSKLRMKDMNLVCLADGVQFKAAGLSFEAVRLQNNKVSIRRANSKFSKNVVSTALFDPSGEVTSFCDPLDVGCKNPISLKFIDGDFDLGSRFKSPGGRDIYLKKEAIGLLSDLGPRLYNLTEALACCDTSGNDICNKQPAIRKESLSIQ